MEKLTERQKLILSLVIHEYTHTAEPVGSKNLVVKYQLDCSSATVRNELAILTEMDFIKQPHTSAGRVPTEKGYRYFVSELMQTKELSEEKRRMIEHQFYQVQQEQGVDGWMKLAASILASQSGAISLVSAPLPVRPGLKHLGLIGITDRQALIALVMLGGQLEQRFIALHESATQTQLSMIANEINHHCYGLSVEQIVNKIKQFSANDSLLHSLLKTLINMMAEVNAMKTGEVFTDGISNVLSEPEFAESEEARRALRIFEEKPALQHFLSRSAQEQKMGGIQVLIGGEGLAKDLQNCSMVLARYGAPNLLSGTIGVLGPIRMQYGKNIQTVRFVASLLSDIVSESAAGLK